MRIFLIANNKTMPRNWILKMNHKFNITSEDKVVRFNHCGLLNLFNGITTDVIFRCDNNGFQGLNKNLTIKNKYINNFRNKIDFSLIHWVDERNQTSKINEMKKIQKINNIKIKNIIPLSKKDKYITGKSPSSGFIGIIILS